MNERRVLCFLTKDDMLSQGWKQAADLTAGDIITAVAVVNREIQSDIKLLCTASDPSNKFTLINNLNSSETAIGIRVKNGGSITGSSYSTKLVIGNVDDQSYGSGGYGDKYIKIQGFTNSSTYQGRLVIENKSNTVIIRSQTNGNPSQTATTDPIGICINSYLTNSSYYMSPLTWSDDVYIPFYFDALYVESYNASSSFIYNGNPIIFTFQSIQGSSGTDGEVFFLTERVDWLKH